MKNLSPKILTIAFILFLSAALFVFGQTQSEDEPKKEKTKSDTAETQEGKLPSKAAEIRIEDEVIYIRTEEGKELQVGKDEIEIGNKDVIDFKPHFKIKKWNEENFVSFNYPTVKKISPLQEDEKLKWQDDKIEFHFYPKGDSNLKVIVVLKEEPATKQDISQLRADLFGLSSKPSEPSQKEVNSELDVNNELDENKKRALEEYHKGLVAYRDDNYKIAIVYFEKALNTKLFGGLSFSSSVNSSTFLTLLMISTNVLMPEHPLYWVSLPFRHPGRVGAAAVMRPGSVSR